MAERGDPCVRVLLAVAGVDVPHALGAELAPERLPVLANLLRGDLGVPAAHHVGAGLACGLLILLVLFLLRGRPGALLGLGAVDAHRVLGLVERHVRAGLADVADALEDAGLLRLPL